TPHILSLAPLLGALETIAEAGGVAALRAKSLAMTAFLIELADRELAGLGFTVVTPRAGHERGGHVSLAHPEAWRICQALKAGGSSANVGRLRLSIHTGTHADAPYHYNDAGRKIDEVPVETYVGPAVVLDVRGHATLTPGLLAPHDFSATPRVLLRSDAWTN